jgi:hypothetical protein
MNRTCSLCLKPTGLVLGVVLQCAVAITHEPARTLGVELIEMHLAATSAEPTRRNRSLDPSESTLPDE